MKISAEYKIKDILACLDGKNELQICASNGTFKLDLKKENLLLWNETIQKYPATCNLLLACEKTQGELSETRLTWVVGSAIRPTKISGPDHAVKLLEALDVDPGLAALSKEHCPGLGEELPWAFYLDRHGWLSASPVLNAAQVEWLLNH